MHDLVQLFRGNMRRAKEFFLWTEPERLNSTTMRKLLKPMSSPVGSNTREKEEELMLHWYRFLDDVEHGLVSVGKD